MPPPDEPDKTGGTGRPSGPEPLPGRSIIQASWIGTIVFSVSAVATAIAPRTFVAVGVGVSLVLFFVGIGLFFWAYAVAVSRSRTDLIGLGGLFFLVGSAPSRVQRHLLGSFGAEVVIGLVTAGVHPFTPLAFGVLASMYGLSLCGLWAAKWGTFPPRPPDEPRAKKKTKVAGTAAPSKGRSTAATRSGRAKGGRVTAPKSRSSK